MMVLNVSLLMLVEEVSCELKVDERVSRVEYKNNSK